MNATHFTNTPSTVSGGAEPITEDDLTAAFTFLGIPACSVCSRLLDGGTDTYRRGGDNPYVCCRTPHCPYCGHPGTGCRHLVAFRRDGKWRAHLFPNKVPNLGIPDSQTLDFDAEELTEAMGTFAPILETVYGAGHYAGPRGPKTLVVALLENLSGITGPLSVNTGGRYNYYYYALNGDQVRQDWRQALDDLSTGKERLKTMTPSAERFRLYQITLPDNAEAGTLTFSPDGRLLAVGVTGEVLLYDVESGEIRHRLPALKTKSYGESTGVLFSPDSREVAVTGVNMSYEWPWGRRSRTRRTDTFFYNTVTGENIGSADAPDETLPVPGTPSDTFLCGSSIYAQIRGRQVRLSARDDAGTTLLGRPFVRLMHRSPLLTAAWSPDGHTFATVQETSDVWDSSKSAISPNTVQVFRVGAGC